MKTFNRPNFVVFALLLAVILVSTCVLEIYGKKQSQLAHTFDTQFEKILKSDLSGLSYAEQQKALQEQMKSISKLTKNQSDLKVAWQSLDSVEAKIKKEYMENNKKVIVAHAKVSKACKLVQYYKNLLKKLQIEIVKIKLTIKKTKLTKSYLKLIKKYKLEMKKAYEIYISIVKVYREIYKEYLIAKKEMSKQISTIKMQLKIIKIMKQKLYSTQSLEIEITKLVEDWEHIIHEEEIEYIHEKEKCHCPVEYRPVCGVNGLTYGSACTARCADVSIHYYGVCKCIPQEVIVVKESSLTSAISSSQ